MAGAKIGFGSAATELLGDTVGNAKVAFPTQFTPAGVDQTAYVGATRMFGENDAGTLVGTAALLSPEVEDDYRLRMSGDTIMDNHRFNYSIQETGKHTFTFTTLAATMTTAGLTTNSSSSNAINTGLNFGTFAQFPVISNQTTSCVTQLSFNEQPTSNTIVDFGLFQRGATTAFAPLDGMYFRLTSAGLQGVTNSGGSETTTGVFPLANGAGTWVYTNNKQHQFLIQTSATQTTFWVNNYLLGSIPTPVGLAMPCKSEALPWSIRHAIVGGAAASSTFKTVVTGYAVSTRGAIVNNTLAEVNSRVLGAYQGFGATIGQLVAGTVTSGTLVKPTAAVPSNTALTANLPNSLGGRIYETLSAGLASNTDGIFAQYQVPAGSTTVAGRRLKISGISFSGFVSTVLVSTALNVEWYIAFGNTAASMATADTATMATATTKAPRRVLLPEFTQAIAANAAAGTQIVQPAYKVRFVNPIYVNAGEFVSLVGNKTGTAATSGVISYMYQFDYSWE